MEYHQQTKLCPMCNIDKPWADYLSKNGRTKYGYCSTCRKSYQVQHHDAKIINEAFGNPESIPDGCEICGQLFERQRPPYRDIDQVTKHFRGYLCRRCNIAIGMMLHNPVILRNAIKYLERFQCQMKSVPAVENKQLEESTVSAVDQPISTPSQPTTDTSSRLIRADESSVVSGVDDVEPISMK